MTQYGIFFSHFRTADFCYCGGFSVYLEHIVASFESWRVFSLFRYFVPIFGSRTTNYIRPVSEMKLCVQYFISKWNETDDNLIKLKRYQSGYGRKGRRAHFYVPNAASLYTETVDWRFSAVVKMWPRFPSFHKTRKWPRSEKKLQMKVADSRQKILITEHLLAH